MKVSHESPIDLLEDSLNYNDYEYALLHLMHIPEYKAFYKKAVENGRMVYLDNSAFEFQFIEGGFNMDYYIEIINEVKPTHVIIPDIIADCEGTMREVENFPYEKINYFPKYMGVVQGKTQEELNKCFDYMNNKHYIDTICLVFHSESYNIDSSKSVDENNMIGRYNFFKSIKNKINKPIHLLGCSLPQEFLRYDDGKIYSIDTSNPVQFGILGEKFSYAVKNKPNCVLSEDIIQSPIKNKELILNNIKLFREGLENG